MLDRLSLRLRIGLFFILLAVAVPIVVGGALAFAAQRLDGGNPLPHLVLAGGIATAGLLVLIGTVWQLFDTNVARPITSISRDLQTLMHANPGHEVATQDARYLGLLAPTVEEISTTLKTARADFDARVAQATSKAEEQRKRLEAILRDLDEGVIVCNRSHQVMLYNRRALAILNDRGELGLARSLFALLERQALVNTLERLTNRLVSGRYKTHKNFLSTPFAFSTRDGDVVLQGKMTLMTSDSGEDTGKGTGDALVTGYVLTFSDDMEEMERRAAADRLLRAYIDDVRSPVTSLVATTQTLADVPDLSQGEIAEMTQLMKAESTRLAERLEQLSNDYEATATSHWPMCDVWSANVLSIVATRYRDNPVIACDVSGESIWLHCDSNTIIELMDAFVMRLVEEVGITTFALTAHQGERRPYVEIVWTGEQPVPGSVEKWADAPLPKTVAGLTAQDILDHHRSKPFCEQGPDGAMRLRIPLLPPVDEHLGKVQSGAPIRLEFYDFDLIERLEEAGDLAGRPLRDLTYVVFDTETTGLEPSKGDEIVSIAGVRVVNGRVLTGEAFDQFVNPKRKIPQRSTLVHGISDEMVKDAPTIETVLPRFRDYVGDSVIVAHNAAFDLRFLELKKDVTGISFDNPVLDTVLLSAIVHDHTDQHTLDAVAERFAIEIPPETRHTALGDSLATAGVLVKMIDLLEVNGIRTLGEALAACNRAVQIRRAQAKY